MDQRADYYEKVIRAIDDDEDEVVLVLSANMLRKVGIEIGDNVMIEARKNELVIRKG
ncbi:hypothetical protein QYF48_22705 [Brevibacillus agri]|uniref:hypothetical protein n=1 Tax=Brevibacillus TaxID=55080 RepID=UPI001399268C|nr:MULTISPECIES: hypothetical protein [Brevibacillus]MCG5252952.1 hypothetical protein [Brevibacillus agri]MDN4095601.1 hypothetical protein [Brevibacillus agri]QHZ58439.1 hypothetical protein M655_023915 [Brevibacillus sp. NSP2.1]